MFNQRQIVSAYLAPAPAKPQSQVDWRAIRTQLTVLKRRHPRLLRRSLLALAIWCGGVASFQNLTGLSPAPAISFGSTGLTVAAPTKGHLAAAVHAPVLPGGPSGQMLPPGALAPDKTYPNGYARGQCTWYVAGRRQVPGNWGNAASWYYHAASSGWAVGTTPALAAIAWTSAGRYGHVALVEQISADGKQVYVSEMNYRGIYVKSFRWVPANQFKYIY